MYIEKAWSTKETQQKKRGRKQKRKQGRKKVLRAALSISPSINAQDPGEGIDTAPTIPIKENDHPFYKHWALRQIGRQFSSCETLSGIHGVDLPLFTAERISQEITP